MNNWSEEAERLELSEYYALVQADAAEWGIYYSVYYSMEYNGFFKDQGLTMNHWRRKYWIYRGEARIGGVVAAPNAVFGLFFIPPFAGETEAIKALKQALLAWSDRTKPITAYDILPDQIDLFSRAGFWPGEFRCRWMQRPTERFNVEWSDDLEASAPVFQPAQESTTSLSMADEISELSYLSYKGTLGGERRKWTSREFYHSWTGHFPNESNDQLRQASSLVYDRAARQLAGVCLVSEQYGMPAVYNIAVAPSHRGHGIATKMLKRALDALKEQGYPLLRLYVMQGNEAEAVYRNLGFVSGPLEVQTCHIPAAAGET